MLGQMKLGLLAALPFLDLFKLCHEVCDESGDLGSIPATMEHAAVEEAHLCNVSKPALP